jgi:hypothetical protein
LSIIALKQTVGEVSNLADGGQPIKALYYNLTFFMMTNKSAVQSITYIICGELLQLAGTIGNTWVANVVVLIGLVFFFNGLGQLKSIVDTDGQKGVGLLSLSAIIGLVAAVLDFIPLMGLFSSLLFTVSFILQIFGFMRLGKSDSIGVVGKSALQLMYIAMGLAIVSMMTGIIPFIGSTVGGLFAIGALMCSLFGWLRLQEGILGKLA